MYLNEEDRRLCDHRANTKNHDDGTPHRNALLASNSVGATIVGGLEAHCFSTDSIPNRQFLLVAPSVQSLCWRHSDIGSRRRDIRDPILRKVPPRSATAPCQPRPRVTRSAKSQLTVSNRERRHLLIQKCIAGLERTSESHRRVCDHDCGPQGRGMRPRNQ